MFPPINYWHQKQINTQQTIMGSNKSSQINRVEKNKSQSNR